MKTNYVSFGELGAFLKSIPVVRRSGITYCPKDKYLSLMLLGNTWINVQIFSSCIKVNYSLIKDPKFFFSLYDFYLYLPNLGIFPSEYIAAKNPTPIRAIFRFDELLKSICWNFESIDIIEDDTKITAYWRNNHYLVRLAAESFADFFTVKIIDEDFGKNNKKNNAYYKLWHVDPKNNLDTLISKAITHAIPDLKKINNQSNLLVNQRIIA